jgi:Carboxypeptidase regulatory-like domain
MRRWRRRPALLVLLLALAPAVAARPLSAQRVTGVVRDSVSRLPIPGAVVTAVDSAGRVSVRTIANEGGRFTMIVPASVTRLRVIRLGFHPQELPLASPRDGTPVDVFMAQLPSLVSTVRVSAGKLCPGSSPRGDAFELWDQARAGLLAAVVAREANPAIAATLVYERTMHPRDDLVRRQAVRFQSGRTTRPFLASAPPSEFAARGYMQEDSTGRTYNAPDADVLLDPSFAGSHCLRVERADAAHPDQVGLAFDPIPGRDSLVDVAGVLWLDSKVPALRTLEFRFTGLEKAAQRSEAGGELTFHTMPNGVVFIEQWVMRIPVMSPLPPAIRSATRVDVREDTRRTERLDLQVVEVREKGGEVVNAAWPDSTRWAAPTSRATGRLVEQGTGRPMENAMINLRGTADTVTTDADGGFSLWPVVPGHYVLDAADTTLVDYAPARTVSRSIDVRRARQTDVALELPPAIESLRQLCKGYKLPDRSSIVVGRLTAPDGRPLGDAEVRAAWQADYKGTVRIDRATETATGDLGVLAAQQVVSVDPEGRFRVCGVVRERPIRLQANAKGTLLGDTIVTVYDSLVKRVKWVVAPPKPAGSGNQPSLTRREVRPRFADPALHPLPHDFSFAVGERKLDSTRLSPVLHWGVVRPLYMPQDTASR